MFRNLARAAERKTLDVFLDEHSDARFDDDNRPVCVITVILSTLEFEVVFKALDDLEGNAEASEVHGGFNIFTKIFYYTSPTAGTHYDNDKHDEDFRFLQ
ncbi:hypothetical protein AB6A40_009252 [Gnathostoma spinigerum]|uniref:Uncharacterized protein n=1 Tax=Gnathostoma spinigerum TaxID=75299 RepID=A0ABD6EZI1_9BILA